MSLFAEGAFVTPAVYLRPEGAAEELPLLTLTAYLGYTQGLSVMRQIYPAGKDGQFGYLEALFRM